MNRRKTPPFATEVALCERFLAAVGPRWTAYAETAGWDILLARDLDGFQIGIQAKLKLNVDVITQAPDEWGVWAVDRPGPDCRAVMVPEGAAGGCGRIADHVGLTVITVAGARPNYVRGPVFWPQLPEIDTEYRDDHWHEQAPWRRHQLPDYIPDVAAGARSPIQLTKWKIAAIKIAVTMERRGFVTRADFKQHRIDHRRWLAPENGWLVVAEGRYTAGARFPNLKAQHPKVYEQIAAESAKWLDAPTTPLLEGLPL